MAIAFEKKVMDISTFVASKSTPFAYNFLASSASCCATEIGNQVGTAKNTGQKTATARIVIPTFLTDLAAGLGPERASSLECREILELLLAVGTLQGAYTPGALARRFRVSKRELG